MITDYHVEQLKHLYNERHRLTTSLKECGANEEQRAFCIEEQRKLTNLILDLRDYMDTNCVKEKDGD